MAANGLAMRLPCSHSRFMELWEGRFSRICLKPERQSFQLFYTGFNAIMIGIQFQIRVQGRLVGIRNSREVRNLSATCPCEQPLWIPFFADFKGATHKNLRKVAGRKKFSNSGAICPVWRHEGGDHIRSTSHQQSRNGAGTTQILRPVL